MREAQIITWLLSWSAAAAVAGWLVPTRWQTAAILICGAGLLATLDPASLAILIFASVLVFRLARPSSPLRHGVPLGIALIVSLFILGAGRAQGGLFTATAQSVATFGMAYYCLRLIHYLIETHKGSLRAHGFSEFLCYQLFPSTLAAGPIHRFDEFLRDLRRRRWDSQLCSRGVARVIHGLAKIVLVANWLIAIKLKPLLAGATSAGDFIGACVASALMWLNLYIQFSGFSDIAIGLGAICGFRIMENFRWPFLARNIGEFWRRWHISLTSWCRDYVYTPVLAISRNHLLAVVTSMIVLGLWHEFSLHYILWGIYHGVGIAVWRQFDGRVGENTGALPPLVRLGWGVTATALTLSFVILSFPVTTAIEQFLLRRA